MGDVRQVRAQVPDRQNEPAANVPKVFEERTVTP